LLDLTYGNIYTSVHSVIRLLGRVAAQIGAWSSLYRIFSMTPPRITIEAELSREGLLSLRDAIEALLTDGDGLPLNPWVKKARQRQADQKVGEVWGRVGDNIRRMLAAAAEWPPGREFTMGDLADVLEVDPRTVRSWHRNLGRTLRAVDEKHPEPSLMPARSDGVRKLYWLEPDTRQAIQNRVMPRPEWE
jgi:hypothetical protein